MAQWIKFKADYDHYWPSRAVTAFRAGMIVFVKDDVAEAALAVGAATKTSKPKDGDPNHVTSGTTDESDTPVISGNTVLSNRAVDVDSNALVTDVPDEGGTVTGDALSAASGGAQTEPVAGTEPSPDVPAASDNLGGSDVTAGGGA